MAGKQQFAINERRMVAFMLTRHLFWAKIVQNTQYRLRFLEQGKYIISLTFIRRVANIYINLLYFSKAPGFCIF